MSEDRDEGLFPLVVAALFVAAAIAAFLVPWGSIYTWKPQAEVFALIVTPLGAVAALIGVMINRHYASETLGQARIAELAGRFQKGAELLASPDTAVAGIAVLRSAALEAPEQYRAPTLTTLTNFIGARGAANPAVIAVKEAPGEPFRGPPPPVDRVTLAAFLALARVLNSAGTFDDPLGDLVLGRYPVSNLYLHGVLIHDTSLSNMLIEGGVVGGVTFSDCDFSNTVLQLAYLRHITFKRCRFSRAVLNLRSGSGNVGAGLRFVECTGTASAMLNARDLDEYLLEVEEWERQQEAERQAFYDDDP